MKRFLLIVSCLIFLTRMVGAQNAESLKNDAISAESHENYAEAAKLFEQAYNGYKDENSADTVCVFRAGLNYVRIRQFTKAIPFLDECSVLNINRGLACRLLADAYFGLKQVEKAEKLLLGGKATIPAESIEFDEKLAYLYFNTGQYEKATGCFQRVARAHPGNKNTLYLYGLSLERIKRYDQAIAVFERMQAEFPDDRRAAKLLGVALFERADELSKAQENNRDRIAASIPDGHTGVQSRPEELDEHYEQARAILEKSLAEYPYDQLLITSLYKLYQRQGEEHRAEQMEKRIK